VGAQRQPFDVADLTAGVGPSMRQQVAVVAAGDEADLDAVRLVGGDQAQLAGPGPYGILVPGAEREAGSCKLLLAQPVEHV